MFGYALPSSERSTVCSNDYRFLGLRVQIQLRRGGKGTSTDTLQGGISGIRLGLGTSPTGSYNETNKRALVGRGNCTWGEFDARQDVAGDAMKSFNREKFLLYMLAGLLTWQAVIFSYGVVLCSRVTPQTNVAIVCPEIGESLMTSLCRPPWVRFLAC